MYAFLATSPTPFRTHRTSISIASSPSTPSILPSYRRPPCKPHPVILTSSAISPPAENTGEKDKQPSDALSAPLSTQPLQEEQEMTIEKPYAPINDDDRQQVNKITSESEGQLDKVAGEVRANIEDLRENRERLADELIEQETQALLEKYQNQQMDLIHAVGKERDTIQQEIDKIENFISSKGQSSDKETKSSITSSPIILQATTLLFGLASLLYAFNAVAHSDSEAFRNSLIDAAVAVCSAYFLSKSTSKK